MIKYLKKIFVNKNKSNNIIYPSENKEIIELQFILDLKTEHIIPLIKIYPYNFIDNEREFLQQAEGFATLLNDFCGDNTYIKDLILESMEILSKNSDNNNLFITNVLFFWKTKYQLKKQEEKKNKMPIIRPINVFKNK